MRQDEDRESNHETENTQRSAFGSLRRLSAVLSVFHGVLALAGALSIAVGTLVGLLFSELQQLSVILMVLGAIALLVLALSWLLRPHNRVARRRQRYGLTAAVSVLAIAGIISLINVLAVDNNVLIDTTASGQYSLAPQTLDVLAERLQGKVEATAFVVDDAEGQDPFETVMAKRMEDYLHEFARRSDGRFSYRVVDPERFPNVATQMSVEQWPVVVFEDVDSGRRRNVPATANPEQDFLTALLLVTGLGQKSIYILEGYSAWDPSSLDADARQGLGFARGGLAADGYAVGTINLLREPAIPADAAAVVVVAPVEDLGERDGAAIEEYLEGGGQLLALLEPNPPPTWSGIAARWGIDVLDGYVIDPASHVAGTPSTPLIGPDNYVATDLSGEIGLTFFPGLAPLWLVRPPEAMPTVLELKPVALVSNSSFGSIDPEKTAPFASDVRGPFLVGAMVRAYGPVDEVPLPGAEAGPVTTVVVFGDADFVSNRYFYAFSNSDLFLNVVNHITGDDALISVRAKPVVFREMAMTPREYAFVRYTGWLLLPLLVVVAGLVAWWRRR